MRIISKFHDYYDGVANMGGHDDTIIYQRETREIPCERALFYDYTIRWRRCSTSRNGKPVYYEGTVPLIYVVFCGELHAALADDLKWDDTETWKRIVAENKQRGRRGRYYAESLAELDRDLSRDYTDLNLQHGAPVLMFVSGRRSDIRLVANPCLKDIGFASALDPYTAFQKLEGFVDTHFTREVDTVEIDPMDRYAMKGFDPKWSFRKEPQAP